MFEDIRKAVNIWLKIDVPDCSSSDYSDMGCDYVLLLLYHIADLLSIKVHRRIITQFKNLDSYF